MTAFYTEELAAIVEPLHRNRTQCVITWQPNGLVDATREIYSGTCTINTFGPANTVGDVATMPFEATPALAPGSRSGTGRRPMARVKGSGVLVAPDASPLTYSWEQVSGENRDQRARPMTASTSSTRNGLLTPADGGGSEDSAATTPAEHLDGFAG